MFLAQIYPFRSITGAVTIQAKNVMQVGGTTLRTVFWMCCINDGKTSIPIDPFSVILMTPLPGNQSRSNYFAHMLVLSTISLLDTNGAVHVPICRLPDMIKIVVSYVQKQRRLPLP